MARTVLRDWKGELFFCFSGPNGCFVSSFSRRDDSRFRRSADRPGTAPSSSFTAPCTVQGRQIVTATADGARNDYAPLHRFGRWWLD